MEHSKKKSDMPLGWERTTLANLFIDPTANIVDGPFGSNLKASEYQDAGAPILRIQNIDRCSYIPKNIKFVTPEKARALRRHSFSGGDILMTKLGDPLGKACILPDTVKPGIIVADLIRIRLDHSHIDKKWLCYVINAEPVAGQLRGLTKGTTRPRVNLTLVRRLFIDVPPLHEQRRIVVKIEELFSELDNGIETLNAAREQLRVYRQALLQQAFEGKLTAQWRTGGAKKRNNVKQILDRLSLGRDAPLPRAEVLAELPTLPDGWIYTYLGTLGDLGRGKSKHRPRNDPALFGGPYPFIQTGEVKAAKRIVRSYSQTYNDFGLAQSKLWPRGTLCITIAANIAETAFLGFDCCFPDSVVGFTATDAIVLPEYVELFIKSIRSRIEAYAPATAQRNINLTTLENIIVPLCSIEEQKELVDRVEVSFSAIDQLEAEIETNLARAETLRQSILRSACSGQLVAQDAEDEPASALFERIKAEKETNNKKTKKREAA